MKAKYILLIILTALFMFPSVFAIEVDKAELESTRNSSILFISYEGPHGRIETREDIRGIGYALGRAIKAGALRAGSTNRYFAIHSVTTGTTQLDADIFGLGIDVGVDHIKNLRLILQGYLEGAYDYSASDAALLAQFITIYNAVYRGNWNYVTSRYTPKVVSELTKEKTGLSIRFDEWPGQSLILIPLAIGQAGSLSAIDTSQITQKPVIEQLKKDKDLGLDARKDMVDLKEREAQEAKQTAQVQKEAIAQEEARLAAEKAALEQDKAYLAEEKTRAEQASEKAGSVQQSGTVKAAAESKKADEKTLSPQELAAKEETIRAQEQAIAKKEQALEAQKQEVAAAEARAAQKEQEAKAERAEIAKDQQQVIQRQEAAKTVPEGLLGISLLQNTNALGRLVLVNPTNGTAMKQSTLNTINSRAMLILPDKIIAIAGQAQGSGAVRLVQIDPKSLEMLKQGDVDIASTSLLWAQGQDIFALANTSGKLYLARFDQNLQLLNKSTTEIHPFASVLFYGETLLTQKADGTPLLLNSKNLTENKAQ
ncbi:P83/100 family protein [Gracilinema caldarium]|uniref:P83100 family protein n=1 Tax=Gracilinema caldarium (strain ATCC 51460 / DSM 7334 / H1) TaxID=744872 RepID=F8F1S9_GRAC1|nr:P83/100 family protein [Gracilinema caldarium]AEJ19413.1 P83100 family protein [Gracilinema caldarium DSM 7334]